MKRLFVFIFTFVLVFFHLTCDAALPVLAADVDYSHLEPDEDGRFWIYFNFKCDEFTYVNDSIVHSADLDFYVDVTDFYLEYGHACLCIFDFWNSNFIQIKVSHPLLGDYSSYSCNYYIKGLYDGVEYDVFNDYGPYLDGFYLKPMLGIDNEYKVIPSEYRECISYLPYWSTNNAEGNFVNFEYIQEKPIIEVFTPQEIAFDYSYDNKGKVNGFNIYLRHLYPTAADFYNKTNMLESMPHIGLSDVNTLYNFRLSAIVGGNEIVTDWLPLKDLAYDPKGGGSFEYPVYNGDIFDPTALFGFFYFDDCHLCLMDFDAVPDLLDDFTGYVSSSSVIVKKLEISAQNHNTVTDQYSDIIYSSYDFYDNTVSNGVVETPPSNNDHGVPNITPSDVNNSNTITNQVDVTLPTINNTVNQGDTHVTVNNNVPGDINVNVNVKPNGDKGTGIFGWLADKVDDATQTVKDIDEGFDELIAAINEFVGDFPGLFSWIMGSLPAPYVIWLELGIAVGIVIVILKVCKIW